MKIKEKRKRNNYIKHIRNININYKLIDNKFNINIYNNNTIFFIDNNQKTKKKFLILS